MVWEAGYRSGDFTAPVYPDAVDALRRWDEAGYRQAVYSSGSVPAQRLLFGNSDAGDLLPLFDAFFDTAVGHKREAGSYRGIDRSLASEPGDVMFLSDAVEELEIGSAHAGTPFTHVHTVCRHLLEQKKIDRLMIRRQMNT